MAQDSVKNDGPQQVGDIFKQAGLFDALGGNDGQELGQPGLGRGFPLAGVPVEASSVAVGSGPVDELRGRGGREPDAGVEVTGSGEGRSSVRSERSTSAGNGDDQLRPESGAQAVAGVAGTGGSESPDLAGRAGAAGDGERRSGAGMAEDPADGAARLEVHGSEQSAVHAQDRGAGRVSSGVRDVPVGDSAGRQRGLLDELDASGREEFAGEPVTFRPGTQLQVPSGPKARFRANLAVLDTLAELDAAQRYATPAEQQVLAQWSSWGALPEVFDPDNEAWSAERDQLRLRLTGQEWDAARVTTVNAHYTDPQIAKVMWDALGGAGFEGGPVIEPGCGAGTFIGQAPESAQMLGVELDPVTARIASYLYPEASIHAYGYEKLTMPEVVAPLAIGNVPFGNFRVHDARYNSARLSIHNYFIAKSLRLVAPGGYAAFVTSSYTMDSATSTARQEIAKYGDLVSAVRLPNTAFKAVAGTDVLTDVLVFRRRKSGEEMQTRHVDQWVKTGQLAIGEDQVTTNQWFIDNPSAIAGNVQATMNRFGDTVMTVESTGDHATVLGSRLTTDLELAEKDGLGYAPETVAINDQIKDAFTAPGVHSSPANEGVTVGQIRVAKDGKSLESFGTTGLWEHVRAGKERLAEYKELVGIKETARELIDAQRLGTVDDQGRDELRASLLSQYQHYAAVYGPINRFQVKAGKQPSEKKILDGLKKYEKEWRQDLDPTLSPAERRDMPLSESLVESWREELSIVEDTRVQSHVSALRRDPDFGLLMSVERFDEELQEARPSTLCFEDIISVNHADRTAQTAADALAISLDETRNINLARIGELLGVSEEQARADLDGLVFEDPATGGLVSSVRYLSGDVVTKLEKAQAAVESGKHEYQENVDALENVKPKTVEHFEINTKPGGFWIEPEEYEKFCLDVFKVTAQVVKDPLRKTWEVQGPPASKFDPAVQLAFGVGRRRSPMWLMEQVMNNRSLRVTKTVQKETPDGRIVDRVVEDEKATIQARSKGKALIQTFGTWLYQDDARRERVVARYNKMFNSYVAPDYSSLSGQLSLPWLSPKFTPHSYQQEAVARITNEPTVLLDHVVGAGKTGTMVMGCMELRRLGIVKKPWIVVPNHLVDQIAREFKQWAPSASVLAIPTGIDEVKRRRYIASSATGDWDAVVVPFSTFEKIQVDPVKTQRWQDEEIAEIRAEMEKKKLKDGGKTTRITVKRLEGQIKRLEERNEALKSAKDAGLTFEDTGCDYLFIDEAHNFKNLRRSSDFTELDHSGSKRATDIAYKLRSLRETKMELAVAEGLDARDYKPAVCTMATGTPVSNSLAEMYVMQKYLRPDLLEERGMETIDAWANQFTISTTKVEMNAAGTEFQARERLSKFINVPELLAMTNQFASVVTRDDITAPLPTLAGGKRLPVVRAASEQVKEYVLELGERAENLPDDPTEDNLLKITGDGRMVALDPRFRGLDADPDGGRIGQVVEQVLRIYEETNHQVYTNSFGDPEPLTGGLQILFSDRGTPQGGDEFNLYDAVADELVANGIPREQIAFIHDVKTGSDRESLFERCRNGKVRVLFGSTEKMGTGTNVQKRSVALHHIDIPWRPSDLEQREGRIIRQGNKNDTVEILNYITEGTFDVYMWQTVARKAEFIAQLKSAAEMDSRTVDDISGDFALMAAEMKALSTGNPKIIEYSQLVSDMHQLQILESTHWNTLANLRERHHGMSRQLRTETEKVGSLTAALTTVRPTAGDAFSMTVNGVQLVQRDTAGRAVKQELNRLVIHAQKNDDMDKKPFVTVGGHQVLIAWQGRHMQLTLAGVLGVARHWKAEAWQQGSGAGLVTRLENMVASIPAELEHTQKKLVKLQEEVSSLEKMDLRAPFPDAEKLEDLRSRAAGLAEELGMTLAETDSTEISEESVATVSGEDLAELFPTHNDYEPHDLRVGDVVNIRSGVNPKGMYEVVQEYSYQTGLVLVDVAAGDDAEQTKVEYVSQLKLSLVSRREDSLSMVEQAMYHLPMTDKLARRYSEVSVGEEVSVRGHGDQKGIVEVRGIVTAMRQEGPKWSQHSILTVKDSEGAEHEVSVQYSSSRIVRHNVVDANAELERLAKEALDEAERRTKHTRARLMPGDMLLADEPGVGLRGDVLMTELAQARYFNTEKFFVTPDGTTIREWDSTYDRAPRTLAVAEGRELTVDETQLLGVGQSSDATEFEATVKGLRVGDRLWSTDLNPKATVKEEVLVTVAGRGTRRDMKYRPVSEPWSSGVSISRMESSTVTVLGRRFGALTEHEYARLSEPERVSLTRLADLNVEPAVDSWVRLTGYTTPPRNYLGIASDRVGVMGRLKSVTRRPMGNRSLLYFEAVVEVDGQDLTIGQFSDDKNGVVLYSGAEKPLPINYAGMPLPSAMTTADVGLELGLEHGATATTAVQEPVFVDAAPSIIPRPEPVNQSEPAAEQRSQPVAEPVAQVGEPAVEQVFVEESVSAVERAVPVEGVGPTNEPEGTTAQAGKSAWWDEHVVVDVVSVPTPESSTQPSTATEALNDGRIEPDETTVSATSSEQQIIDAEPVAPASSTKIEQITPATEIADAPVSAADDTAPESLPSVAPGTDQVLEQYREAASEPVVDTPAAASAQANEQAPGMVIDHRPAGTKVSGTEKGSPAIKVLKSVGFKWSSRQGIWYLTSTWKPETRQHRVSQLKAELDRQNIAYALAEDVQLSEAAVEPTVVAQEETAPAGAVVDASGAAPVETVKPETQEEIAAPAQAPAVSASRPRTLSVEPGMLITVNLSRHRLLDVDQAKAQQALLQDLVVQVERVRGMVAEGDLRVGDRSWPVRIDLAGATFEVATPEAEQQFRQNEFGAVLSDELDSLIGIPAVDVPLGSMVSLDAHEYRSLNDLNPVRPPSEFANVELLSTATAGKAQLWVIRDQAEQQRMVVFPHFGQNLVQVHERGAGAPSVPVEPFPTVSRMPLMEVQPGQRVTVRGISSETEFSLVKEIVEQTGEFLNIQEAPSGEALVSLMVDGEPEYVVVKESELTWQVNVETPVGFEPMVEQDVAQQYMAPELSGPSAGVDRQERRIMSAGHVYPGSVLVNNAGVRVAVVDARRISQAQVELMVTPAENPTKQKSLIVSENKQFSVEPLPVALGATQPVLGDEIGVGYNYCQVWWDETSKDAGFHLTGATDIGNPTRTFRLEDGSGKSFRLTVDSRQEMQVRLLQPQPVFTKDHSLDADVEAQMEAQALQDQMNNPSHRAGM